ncbi:PREDICTED: C4b-binding protein beta chain isoform X3 [Dipodomys ordii]|uniref:C4b-binding protein beta chain isoform X3 n=1 Tax=Dipodomys ordii TaxID=10020 RepID=A0A1S3F985_DIPOR|nr:PREDICTED: C4b-binding protein beta chain isoform X3 [Dipodomys ordii]
MFDHLMFCRIGSCLMIMWLISASGEMSCPEFPPVDNSIFIAKEEEGQIWGTYLCTEGYHMVGQETFWCNNSKVWDAFTPECRLGHCPDPVLANGEFNSSGLVNVRDKVTFKCNEHYILKGSNWSECLGDHTWGPPLPICKSRDCDPPGKLAHGYFEGEFTSGSVVTYFCKERVSFGPQFYHLVFHVAGITGTVWWARGSCAAWKGSGAVRFRPVSPSQKPPSQPSRLRWRRLCRPFRRGKTFAVPSRTF